MIKYFRGGKLFMSIKRVKLNYRPVAKRTSNEIAFEGSRESILRLNKTIHNKIERNKLEQCVYPYDYQNVIVRKRTR